MACFLTTDFAPRYEEWLRRSFVGSARESSSIVEDARRYRGCPASTMPTRGERRVGHQIVAAPTLFDRLRPRRTSSGGWHTAHALPRQALRVSLALFCLANFAAGSRPDDTASRMTLRSFASARSSAATASCSPSRDKAASAISRCSCRGLCHLGQGTGKSTGSVQSD